MIVARGVGVSGQPGRPALDDLSFEVNRGAVYALLGSRTAGKDTLIRVLRGAIRSAKGSLAIDGFDVGHHAIAARKRVAIAGVLTGLYGDLSPARSVTLLARLSGVSPPRRAVSDALRAAGVPERLIDAPARRLEPSHRLSVGVALGLLRSVPVFVLDEPTDAADARIASSVIEIVGELRQRKHTVLITTSDVSLASAVSDRVGLLRAGRVETECSPSELLGWSLPDFLLEFAGQSISSGRQSTQAG